MKSRTTALIAIVGMLFLGCESPTKPEEKSFWKYSGPIDEDGIRYGLETSCILAEKNLVLLGTLDYGLIVLKDYKLYHREFVSKLIFALAGTNDKNFWLGTNRGIYIGYSPRIWEPTGLEEFDVISITVQPYGVFAGTDNGLFVTQDYGKTWYPMTDNKLMSLKVTALLIKGRDIFAGTSNGDLFFSDNGGNSWIETDFDSQINVISSANGNVLVGANTGVYYSSDNGNTWKKSSLNYKTSAFAIHNGTVYAGTLEGNGIYESSDNGKTWTDFETDGLEELSITAISVSGDDHLLAGTASKGLFRTTDTVE